MKIFTIYGDGYTMNVAVNEHGTGRISSDLLPPDDGDYFPDREQAEVDAGLEAIERVVLAHAVAGIDVAAPAYIEGLNVAINALTS